MLPWCPERGSNPHAPFRGRRILSPLRLPVSPSGRRAIIGAENKTRPTLRALKDGAGGATRSRTGLDGFAIRCITALLSRQGGTTAMWMLPRRKGSTRLPFLDKTWSGIRDSNSRPIPWQGIALPTELIPHVFLRCCTSAMLYFFRHVCHAAQRHFQQLLLTSVEPCIIGWISPCVHA